MRHRHTDTSPALRYWGSGRKEKKHMEKKIYDLTVNEKFRRLCPPLCEAERAMLEESILAKGCEMPLIVWAGKDTIVDGHNRYSICREHGIPFAISEEVFETEGDVLYWIVMNQIGRRNLNTYSKIELVLPLVDILEQGAMQRMLSGRKQDVLAGTESSQGKGRVSEHIAAMVGSSGTVVKQVKKIVKAADEETKMKLRSGDLTINAAYTVIRREEKKAASQAGHDGQEGSETDASLPWEMPDTKATRPNGGSLSPLLDKPIVTDPAQRTHIDRPIIFNPVPREEDPDAGEPGVDCLPIAGDSGAETQVKEMTDDFLEELNDVLETTDAVEAAHILELIREMSNAAEAAVRRKMNDMEN